VPGEDTGVPCHPGANLPEGFQPFFDGPGCLILVRLFGDCSSPRTKDPRQSTNSVAAATLALTLSDQAKRAMKLSEDERIAGNYRR
jgi:hypothetical protein